MREPGAPRAAGRWRPPEPRDGQGTQTSNDWTVARPIPGRKRFLQARCPYAWWRTVGWDTCKWRTPGLVDDVMLEPGRKG
jgi:hypothetical protein